MIVSDDWKAAMTSSTSDDNSVLLVHAYLDDELDPANALEIAQRISTDPALAAEGRRVTALTVDWVFVLAPLQCNTHRVAV